MSLLTSQATAVGHRQAIEVAIKARAHSVLACLKCPVERVSGWLEGNRIRVYPLLLQPPGSARAWPVSPTRHRPKAFAATLLLGILKRQAVRPLLFRSSALQVRV